MNKYVFFATFLCAWALISAKPNHEEKETSNSTEVSEKHFKQLAQQINDKYNTTLFLDAIKMGEAVKEKCPNIEEKMDSVIEEIQTCVEEIKMGSDTFCSTVSKNFVKCYKPAGEIISSCLPEETKDLPIMMGKVIHAVIAQSCHSTVEEILELFNPCIIENNPKTIPACQQLKTAIDEHTNEVPTKSVICQTLPKVKNCIKAMVEGSCKNQITKNAVIKFYDAIEDAVKDECDALNKA